MKTGFIETIIKKNNRRRIIIAVIILAIAILPYFALIRYYYNFILGPFEIDASTLMNANKASDIFRYFVNVKGNKIYDTGFEYVTVHDSGYEETDYYYFALEIGRELMLVESPDYLETTQITGFIKSIPSDIEADVLGELIRENPSLQGQFMPFMLKTNSFRTGGWVWLVFSLLMGGIGLIILVITLIHASNPASHPVMKALRPFGEPKRLAEEINREVALSKDYFKHVTLTDHWLFYHRGTAFKATRFEDVIWIYKRIVQHRTYGVPTGKTFAALIYDRYKKKIEITGKEEVIDQLLAMTNGRAPWAVTGYSRKLEKLYKKDRTQFLSHVDQRKAEIQS